MPVPLDPNPPIVGTYLPMDVIQTLVQNFFDMTKKKDPDTGAIKSLNPKEDSYTIWFKKQEIDDLFAQNMRAGDKTEDFGLRIYLCQHSDTDIEMDQVATVENQQGGKPNYNYSDYKGQHGVVLVVTQKDRAGADNDLLSIKNYVSVSAIPLTGLDVGQPCPPPSACIGAKIIPV